ncbi:MAG: DNA-directed RNA polymerase subunit alpha [Flavobacteriales bacterium]
MTILNFIKPDKVTQLQATPSRGEFEFRPLEPGYGLTVGNAIRRVLLSALEGFAITALKIEGIEHEFSTIQGVVEDVTEIVLNLKKVRFKQQIEGMNDETASFSIAGKEVITAGDMQKFLSNFQILNPELVICRLSGDVVLSMTLTIAEGRGYVPAEENKVAEAPVGTIFIDSIFTPIKNVKYRVENYRVGQKTDYEKLLLDIETDGSISPKDALTKAAKVLIQHFMLFADDRITVETDEVVENSSYDEGSLHMRQLLNTKLMDLDLSVRALNCLKAAEVETLGELVTYKKSDLMKFRNFGKKSLIELAELIDSKGLQFGMDLTDYKLDGD